MPEDQGSVSHVPMRPVHGEEQARVFLGMQAGVGTRYMA